jgi:hypothetical protein
MGEFVLTRYQDGASGTWDGIVDRARNGTFLHLRSYLGYHAHRFDEHSVIVERGGKPVAVFPCNRNENCIISHGGLTYGGLIYGSELCAVDVLTILEILSTHFKGLGCQKLVYKAIPHIFHRYPAEEDLYALFRLGAHLARRDISSVVQVENRIRFSELRRRKVKRAAKQGVELREGGFFEDFHSLLSQALAKFGASPVHSVTEMQLLRSRFPERIRLFGAFEKGALLAGTLVYDFGHVAHTQYLASSQDGREVGALDYVLSHLLDEVFVQHRYFSFGISTEQAGRYLNEGLIFQKEGFGGRGVAHDFYELEL